MKLALFADLHANLQALQACLADARARGATQHAFLGDFVGYGADPVAVVDLVMDEVARGAWAVRGNHDEAAISQKAPKNDHASAAWTHAQLHAGQRGFLQSLPLEAQHGHVLLVHASAHEPSRWDYLTTPLLATASMNAAYDRGATHTFCGHVHEQRLFYDGARRRVMAFEPTPGVAVPVVPHRRWLATVGSVGQPRDGRADAMYALYDDESHRLNFLRIPYDHAAAAAAIRRAGLPEDNALRLARGK